MSTLTVSTISNGSVSTSSANVIQGSAKAWCNWNGYTSAIRASYNVSSVTKLGTGDYRVNLTNALVDANYSAVASSARDTSGSQTGTHVNNITASVVGVLELSPSGFFDSVNMAVAVFR